MGVAPLLQPVSEKPTVAQFAGGALPVVRGAKYFQAAPVRILSGIATVRRKLVCAVVWPSLTVSVRSVKPVCPAEGVTEMVRLAPLPPMVMLATGTSVTLLDAAVIV